MSLRMNPKAWILPDSWLEDLALSPIKFGQLETYCGPGHLIEAYNQLSALNLLNRRGGRNRFMASCDEQYQNGVALWPQFTDIFKNICEKTNLARAETVMAKLHRVHSANAEYRSKCFRVPELLEICWKKNISFGCGMNMDEASRMTLLWLSPPNGPHDSKDAVVICAKKDQDNNFVWKLHGSLMCNSRPGKIVACIVKIEGATSWEPHFILLGSEKERWKLWWRKTCVAIPIPSVQRDSRTPVLSVF